jgi:uncharacterized protein
LPAYTFPRDPTLRQFDDLYTAPRGGFADALDYYRRSSSCPLIPRIELPTLLMTARDDPFIAVKPFQELPAKDNVEVRIEERGGHLGFLGRDGQGGVRWAEPQLANWILRTMREQESH